MRLLSLFCERDDDKLCFLRPGGEVVETLEYNMCVCVCVCVCKDTFPKDLTKEYRVEQEGAALLYP